MKKKLDMSTSDINDIGLLPEVKILWNSCRGKGRTWGKKGDGRNPYFGSHIFFLHDDEIVLLVGGRKKGSRLKLFQFKLTAGETVVGEKLLAILADYGVSAEMIKNINIKGGSDA